MVDGVEKLNKGEHMSTHNSVPFNVTKENVTVFLNFKPIVVPRRKKDGKDNPVAAEILQAIKDSDWDRVVELVNSTLFVVPAASTASMRVEDGQLFVDGEIVADEFLTQRVIDFRDEGLPFDGLINFIRNLRLNPSARARRALFKFLENGGHPITEDGHFLAYKRVREDYTDCHTGKFNNAIGSVVEMPRINVDDDPERTCSHGLHVAAREYAINFYGHHGRMVIVKVNPADVVAIPVDYNNQKMRCCRYEVVGEDEGLMTTPYVPTGGDFYPEDDDPDSDYDMDDYDDDSDCQGDCSGCDCEARNPQDGVDSEDQAQRVFWFYRLGL